MKPERTPLEQCADAWQSGGLEAVKALAIDYSLRGVDHVQICASYVPKVRERRECVAVFWPQVTFRRRGHYVCHPAATFPPGFNLVSVSVS